MKYYKQISDGYIICIGTGGMGEEIAEEEYNAILSAIQTKPADTEIIGHRLREDLTWESYEKDPPDPDPDIDEAEVYNILFGGVES